MTKRALVAGINNYTNWNSGVRVGGLTLSAPNLSFCNADADSFAQLLNDGFVFDEVTVLKDSQATSSAILNGIKQMLAASAAGDVMCFYFSGHGGRIAESPGSSSTRYHETIVPYDKTMISSRDVASIANSLQPSFVNFTLVLDSCHSGGMFLSPDSRGFTCDRGAAAAFQAACSTIVPWICLLDATLLDGNVSDLVLQTSGLCSMSVDTSKDTVDNAKATLLSACDYSELSRESRSIGHGYFTQAIMDVVNSCNFQISHSDFLAQVQQKVTGYAGGGQTPQLRGRPVRLEENFLVGWNYSI
ncbi:MAG: caspase family protein [Acidobacteriota bacterium]|nr:caspase family protein [Acidobacteriota bacterium]